MASSTRVFGKACRTLMAAAKGPTATATATKAKAKKPEAAAAAAAVKAPSGITKEVPISPALGQFMGSSEASRTGAVKKVWEYIKLNNLQNPANKREIFCDAKLKTIFDGKDQVGFTEVAKLLSQHFVKT